MPKIIFPLTPRQQSAAVAALQDALQQLLDRPAILVTDLRARWELGHGLKEERAKQTYGNATQKLVSAFQSEHRLKVTGTVDEGTAQELNAFLGEREGIPSKFRAPLTEGSTGADVSLVQEILTALGHGIVLDEIAERRFGATTATAVIEWRRKEGLTAVATLDLGALKRLWDRGRDIVRSVRGTVALEDGASVPDLFVQAVDHDFRSEQILGATTTDYKGQYRIEYTAESFTRAEKGSADLGVRVFAADRKTLLHSPDPAELSMNAPIDVTIDVVVTLPPGELTSEFDAIARELRPLIGSVAVADIAKDEAEGLFLAREIDIERDRLAHFVVAHRVTTLFGVRADYVYALLREDGLFGITLERPRAVQVPVTFTTDPRAVFYETVLLDEALASAAMTRAIRKRLVNPAVQAEAAAIRKTLDASVEAARAYVAQQVPRSILDIIEKVIDADRSQELLDLLGSHDVLELPSLFQRLDVRGAFAAADRDEAETRLQLGELLGFNVNLVDHVSTSLGVGTTEDIRGLARLQRADWTNIIAEGTTPIAVGGRTIPRSLARRQASIIVRRFEKTFPTAAFSAQLARNRPGVVPRHGGVAAFLDAHPDFELGKHKVAPFLKEKETEEGTNGVDPEVVRAVEQVQRVFQLAGDYRKTTGLLEAGYTASADIIDAGKSRFVADATRVAGMTTAEAEKTFAQAQNTNFGAVLVATTLRTISGLEARALDGPPDGGAFAGAAGGAFARQIDRIVAEQPDLATLFGPTDACECGHCRSIYGPAAYFADVVRFLRNRLVRDTATGTSSNTAKTVLFSRRPDLGEIDLNCRNAEVPVPHIDIVCELLEEAIAPDLGFPFTGTVAAGKASAALIAAVRGAGYDITDVAVSYGPYAPNRYMLRDETITVDVVGPGPTWTLRRLRQTHGSPDERAAAPEYVNDAAYTAVKSGKAAFGLPYDLDHAQTRAFLAAAGIDRAELMKALQSGGNPSDDAIAGEILGLSAAERALIFTASVADQPAIWSVPGPAASATMKKLNVFLQRAGLEYRDAEALIGRKFVRMGLDLFIRHLDNTCTLSKKEIVNLDDAALDRIHRVLRLSRKTGISTRDIDRLAAGLRLGTGHLGTAALSSLATLQRLSTELQTDIATLITWLDVIPIAGDPSDHARLFQNPSATGPLSPNLTPAAIINSEKDEALNPGTGLKITPLVGDLAIAFGVRPDELAVYLSRISETPLYGADPPLTFGTIAALYGRVGLGRVLGLKAVDFVTLEHLANIEPLNGATEMRDYVRAARAIEATDVSIKELDFRLVHAAADPTRELADDAITSALQSIRTALVGAAAVHRSPYDDALQSSDQITALEALLQRQPALSADDIAALADVIRRETPTVSHGTAAKAVVNGPLAMLVDGAAVKAAIDAVIAATTDDSKRKALLKLVMDGVSAAALKTAAFEAANDAMTSLLRIEAELTSVILRGARITVGAATKPLAELLTTGDIADPAIALTAAPDLYRAVRLAHSVAGLVAPFEPSPQTVAFLFDNAAALGWPPLDGMPFIAAMPPVALADWLMLADVFAIVAEHPPVARPGQPDQSVSAEAVFKLATGAVKSAFLADFAVLTGLPTQLITEADAQLALPLADYRTPSAWRALIRAVGFLHTLGAPIADATGFTADALGPVDARHARRMLRSRHSDAEWLGALKNIMDPIREQKRDALVTFLLAANPILTSKADLYDYFLTDTEWSAKMPSSRIVQAHSTLQLFIHRCIAGLEPNATADLDGDQDWTWWEWMRNYRVWEVQRKVFVEPQYYLRPEWRDDKTEPFQDLESSILQNEINEENTNTAFEGYLDALDQLAFLDVLTVCFDPDHNDLHVFACTKGGDPRTYYHRVFQRQRVWTSWKKIDLDISGDHLVAFFRGKRLYLAWTTFLESGDDQQRAVMPNTPGGTEGSMPPAKRQTEIRLAVSEYTGRKWLPRRVSAGALYTPMRPQSLDQSKIFLTVTPDPARFSVDVFSTEDGLIRLGSFLLTGCKGYPEAVPDKNAKYMYWLPQFKDTLPYGQRIAEANTDTDDDLAISLALNSGYQTLFTRTPGIFRVTYPFLAHEFDHLLTTLINSARYSDTPSFRGSFLSPKRYDERITTLRPPTLVFGTLMPFFFEDNQHGYIIIPGYYERRGPDVKTHYAAHTFSSVRQLFVDGLALTRKYLAEISAQPSAMKRADVTQQLAADPEYARLLSELERFRSTEPGYVVRNFYHPLACFLRQRFFEGGVRLLLARETQLTKGSFVFEHAANGYAPSAAIFPPYPLEELEFARDSAYAIYNWELTFHAPHLIASKLMAAERFDEAETWLRYVFDPLGSSNDPAPHRYWNTKPFHLRSATEYGAQMIAAIMERSAKDPDGTIETDLADAILEWRRNPLKPYLVARARTVAFQQAIVDLTIRLFMGRGDLYFRRGELEDLVIASLNYSRAERLAGARPKLVPPVVVPPSETYNQLESKLDQLGNALRKIENLLPDVAALPHGGAELPPLPITLESLYFCIPPSEKLYDVWDTLEERQFNLRNSRTIEGVERTISLFAPPLSVEALIAAAAAGLSISAILGALSAPRPPYRFKVMLRHAIDCAEAAAAFSQDLQQALTSRDSEELSRIRSAHERRLLDEHVSTLQQEIGAAKLTVQSAQATKTMHRETQQFFAGRPYMNDLEIAANVFFGLSLATQVVMSIGYIAAGGLKLIPKFTVGAAGFGGSPEVNAQYGGDQIGDSARDLMVKTVEALSGLFEKTGGLLERQASYKVRKEDWDHTARQAQREVERADIEIAIAKIREKIATDALRVHGVKQQQAAAEDTFLRTKFTNRELFEWLAQQTGALAKQMFNLAFTAAKAAERCYGFELGTGETFIRAGLWNDTRRGFLAATNLITDLRRMESAHLQRNVRERELMKHLSVARLDPTAILELRTTGRCTLQVPEVVFDLEHPGHYFRRIKALSVSVPAVAGPYTSVPLKLTQTSNRIRTSTARKTGGGLTDAQAYAEDPAGDTRFSYNVASNQSISTSRGDDDSGLFALEFEDERYLPFEGSGVIGTYVLEFPPTLRPFDYGTVTDVILHFRYTARDGGGGFRTMVAGGIRDQMNVIALKAGRTGLFQAIDVRRDRPDVWSQLVTTGASTLRVTADELPYFTSTQTNTITTARALARISGNPTTATISFGGAAATLSAASETGLKPLLSTTVPLTFGTPMTIATANPAKLEELIIVMNYAMG
jgi:peptidoglycan hydrolase-like protein with peptidoglycan-binding domain